MPCYNPVPQKTARDELRVMRKIHLRPDGCWIPQCGGGYVKMAGKMVQLARVLFAWYSPGGLRPDERLRKACRYSGTQPCIRPSHNVAGPGRRPGRDPDVAALVARLTSAAHPAA